MKMVKSILRKGLYAILTAGTFGCGIFEPDPIQTSQTATLENSVDISYRATLDGQKPRTTLRNGNVVNTKTISGPSYSEMLRGQEKGNYAFVIDGDTARVEVPNYESELNLQGAQTNFDEYGQLELDLTSRVSDKNPEDNPVLVKNARSPDGKMDVSLNGYQLTAEPKALGTYQIELDLESKNGDLETKVIQGNVTRAPDQIAFWSNRPVSEGGYNEDIYVGDIVNEKLVNVKRLTTHAGQDLEPTYSPNGKEILFTSHRTGGTAVWRMNADGSNQRDITSSIVERARQADWCSNGKVVLAYRNKGDTEAGIGIMNPAENSFTPIYSEPRTGQIPGWPRWSPDCSSLAFERYTNGNWEIFTMNSDGSNLLNITNDPSGDLFSFFSSDQNEILFRSDRSGNPDIYIMGIDGSNVRRITTNQGVETEPKLSYDKSHILFVYDDISFFNPQLYLMNSDGAGSWTKLTSEGANRYPSWRPRK